MKRYLSLLLALALASGCSSLPSAKQSTVIGADEVQLEAYALSSMSYGPWDGTYDCPEVKWLKAWLKGYSARPYVPGSWDCEETAFQAVLDVRWAWYQSGGQNPMCAGYAELWLTDFYLGVIPDGVAPHAVGALRDAQGQWWLWEPRTKQVDPIDPAKARVDYLEF